MDVVRSFGTEGRNAAEGLPEKAGTSQIYEFILFKGAEIKDLLVISGAEETPAAATPSAATAEMPTEPTPMEQQPMMLPHGPVPPYLSRPPYHPGYMPYHPAAGYPHHPMVICNFIRQYIS